VNYFFFVIEGLLN